MAGDQTGSRDPWTVKTLRPLDRWPDPTLDSPSTKLAIMLSDYRYEFGSRSVTSFSNECRFEDEYLNVDYYASNLHGKKHTSYIGEDENGGPVVVILEDNADATAAGNKFATRKVLIITQKETTRLLLPTVAKIRNKVLLKQLRPDLATANLHKCRAPSFSDDLLEFEKKQLVSAYKFGLLYQRQSQTEEDQWYNNVENSDELEEFLQFLGERVTLKGWQKFRGGLQDVKTGTHSVYTTCQKYEIMFHVSTLLPFYAHDPQQIERKRHLGNDICVVLFRDSNVAERFDPIKIKSQLNHVFCVVQPDASRNDGRYYHVAFVSKQGVLPFGPLLPAGGSYAKSEALRQFLLHKLINAERAALLAPDFQPKLWHVKRQMLQELVSKYPPDPSKMRQLGARVTGRMGEMMGSVMRASTEDGGPPTDPSVGSPSPLTSPKRGASERKPIPADSSPAATVVPSVAVNADVGVSSTASTSPSSTASIIASSSSSSSSSSSGSGVALGASSHHNFLKNLLFSPRDHQRTMSHDSGLPPPVGFSHAISLINNSNNAVPPLAVTAAAGSSNISSSSSSNSTGTGPVTSGRSSMNSSALSTSSTTVPRSESRSSGGSDHHHHHKKDKKEKEKKDKRPEKDDKVAQATAAEKPEFLPG